jgi:hypothetical protein
MVMENSTDERRNGIGHEGSLYILSGKVKLLDVFFGKARIFWKYFFAGSGDLGEWAGLMAHRTKRYLRGSYGLYANDGRGRLSMF